MSKMADLDRLWLRLNRLIDLAERYNDHATLEKLIWIKNGSRNQQTDKPRRSNVSIMFANDADIPGIGKE